MRDGLFRLDTSAELWPTSAAVISDATNIREVILDFADTVPIRISPRISYGAVSYHFNYFLRPFRLLHRVEFCYPWSPTNDDVSSFDPEIDKGNSHLKSHAKLSSIRAEHREDDAWRLPFAPSLVPWEQWESRDNWFWQADEGKYLKNSILEGGIVSRNEQFHLQADS